MTEGKRRGRGSKMLQHGKVRQGAVGLGVAVLPVLTSVCPPVFLFAHTPCRGPEGTSGKAKVERKPIA